MVSFQSCRTSCFCDEYPTSVWPLSTWLQLLLLWIIRGSSPWKSSLTWWFWCSQQLPLHEDIAWLPRIKSECRLLPLARIRDGPQITLPPKQQQQQERQSIWNSGFQDTRHQAGKDSELWVMENRWGVPYPFLSLLPGESSPACAGRGDQAEPSGLRIEQLGNQGDASRQNSQDRLSGRGDLHAERTSEICWGPLEYSAGSQFICAMKLPKSREITLQRVRGDTAQPTGRARNTACSYKSDRKTCDSWLEHLTSAAVLNTKHHVDFT